MQHRSALGVQGALAGNCSRVKNDETVRGGVQGCQGPHDERSSMSCT